MRKNESMFRKRLSIKKYNVIAAKLAFVRSNGILIEFRIDWKVPKFHSFGEMEDWKRKEVFERGLAKIYYAKLEEISTLPQVSLRPDEIHYLEDFLLLKELPVVTVSASTLQKNNKGFERNRKWDSAPLFHRLHEAVENGEKFPKVAKILTSLMPEAVLRKSQAVKANKLRKNYSRGFEYASRSKKDY